MRGNDAVEIGEGSIAVNAGDDAFHSEYLFYIADGTVNVGSCVEGYEAEKILVHGGETSIVASDDGVNASAAEDSATTGDASQGAASQDSKPPVMPQGEEPPQDGEGTPPARSQGDAGERPQGGTTPPDRQGGKPQDVGGTQDGTGPGMCEHHRAVRGRDSSASGPYGLFGRNDKKQRLWRILPLH